MALDTVHEHGILGLAAGQGLERAPGLPDGEVADTDFAPVADLVSGGMAVTKRLTNAFREVGQHYVSIPNALWEDSSVPLHAIRVWSYLADRSSDKSPNPWPSYQKMATDLHFDRRSAMRGVAWLKENGYLKAVEDGPHGVNIYVLTCPALEGWVSQQTKKVTTQSPVVTELTLGSDRTDTKTSDRTDTQTKTKELNQLTTALPAVSAPENEQTKPPKPESITHKLTIFLDEKIKAEHGPKSGVDGDWGKVEHNLKPYLKRYTADEVAKAIRLVFADERDWVRDARTNALSILKSTTFNRFLYKAVDAEPQQEPDQLPDDYDPLNDPFSVEGHIAQLARIKAEQEENQRDTS